MSAGLMGIRPLARLAWREVIRRKGRTALVVALIAVPTMILTFASVAVRTSLVEGDRYKELHLGPLVDIMVSQYDSGPLAGDDPQSVKALIPPSIAHTDVVHSTARLGSGRDRLVADIHRADWASPLLSHRYILREGRWPTVPGETAVGRFLANRLDLSVGSTLQVTTPRMTAQIVGRFDVRDDYDAAALAFAPDASTAASETYREAFVDLGPSPTKVELTQLANLPGLNPHYPAFTVGGPANQQQPGRWTYELTNGDSGKWTALAMMQVGFVIALFLLGILAAAAFAVGARRQLRQLGLVGASGGDPGQVGRVITLQGTVTAAFGWVLGLALGCLAVIASAPYWNRASKTVVPGIVLQPLDWVLAGGSAVLAGSIAAGLAARQARRAPILAALAGRRPLPPATARLPIAGGLSLSLGLGLVWFTVATSTRGALNTGLKQGWFWAAIGGVLVLFGGVLCTPYLIGRMDGLAGQLRGAKRLAARRIARSRARSGPLTGAIMAATAVAIAVATLSVSNAEAADRSYRRSPTFATNQVVVRGDGWMLANNQGDIGLPVTATDLSAVAARVTANLPGAKTATFSEQVNTQSSWLQIPSTTMTGWIRPIAGTPELLRLFGMEEEDIARFEAGMVVVDNPAAVVGDNLTLDKVLQRQPTATDPSPTPEVTTVRMPAMVLPGITIGQRMVSTSCDDSGQNLGCSQVFGTLVVLPPQALQRLAFDTPAVKDVLIVLPKPLTRAQSDTLGKLREDLQFDRMDAADAAGQLSYGTISLQYESYRPASLPLLQAMISGLALLLALVVVAIALALAAVDSRPDDATLAALGAGPSTRRQLRAWEAALLAAIGVVLAVPIGFLPAAVTIMARNDGQQIPIMFPWITVLLVVLGVPVAAWLTGWLTARTPRQVPTTHLQFD